jgi:hypothetical protein
MNVWKQSRMIPTSCYESGGFIPHFNIQFTSEKAILPRRPVRIPVLTKQFDKPTLDFLEELKGMLEEIYESSLPSSASFLNIFSDFAVNSSASSFRFRSERVFTYSTEIPAIFARYPESSDSFSSPSPGKT